MASIRSAASAPRGCLASDGSDGDRSANRFKTPKDEIVALRADLSDMEPVLMQLQRKRLDGLRRYGKWKRLAYEQSEARTTALVENKKLRRAMAECRQLSASLLQLMAQPRPQFQVLGSLEDNEWRVNMLGFHPRRRHWNANRIMEQLYRKLLGWAINSGLVDAAEEMHFSRCENRDQAGLPMHLEVDLCRRIDGHYVDVAAAVWRYFTRDNVDTGTAASVRIETSEILGDRIRHNMTTISSPTDRDRGGHTAHHLSQRIEEDSRIVIMWKAVIEDSGESSFRFTDNADGWISFEKSKDRAHFTETCLMKCSSMVLVLPLDQVGQGSDEYLFGLLRMMNLSLVHESSRSADKAERARGVFADFLFETLWRHSSHVARLAASASSAVQMSF